MSKIKLTPIQTVAIWNKLDELNGLSDDPVYTAWAHRMKAYLRPEVIIWNGLSIEERNTILECQLQYQIEKLPAEYLPDFIVESDVKLLSLVTEGSIRIKESQISKSLQSQSKIVQKEQSAK